MFRIRAAIVLVVIAVSAITLLWVAKKSSLDESPLVCDDCNLIVISLTGLRRHQLGITGYQRPTSPNIDRFFRQAIVLENVFAPASLTYTDALSFFYGLFPAVHQLMSRTDVERSQNALAGRVSFPEILQRAGFLTAAFVSDEDYNYRYGVGRIFNHYFDRSMYREYNIDFLPWRYNISTKDLVPPVADWLKENSQKRFFLFMQNYDLHCPFNPEEPFKQAFEKKYDGHLDDNICYMSLDRVEPKTVDGKKVWPLQDWHYFVDRGKREINLTEADLQHLVNMYDGEILQADSRLQPLFQLIDELNLRKNTIIVFMSEHGDYLGENGYFMKSAITPEGNLHNVNLGTTFLFYHPKNNILRRISSPAHMTDLAPTLLQMLGVDHSVDPAMQGQSLLPNLDQQKEINEFVYTGTVRRRRGQGVWRLESLQNLDWKLSFSELYEFETQEFVREEVRLFDLQADPNEENDLVASRPEKVSELKKRLLEARGRNAPRRK